MIALDSKILIIGGTGVIGRYIVKAFLRKGYTNIVTLSRRETSGLEGINHIKADVLELHPLTDAIYGADYVVLASAVVSYDPRKFKYMHRVNIEGTANVVNLALESSCKKLIHVSSIAALSRDERTKVLDESNEWTNSEWNSYYGVTKYFSEQEVWRAHTEGLKMAIVNPSLVLGSGDWKESSLQIFGRVYKGLPFHPGGGTGVVDAKDVANAIVLLMESNIEGERFILSAENIQYVDLFHKMANKLGVKGPTKKAPKWILQLMWRLEWLKSRILGSTPLITRHSVKTMGRTVEYDHSKSLSIPGFTYRNLDDSIAEYCRDYLNDLSS